MRRRAIFTDRDGTICEDVGYLSEAAQLRLIPGAADALARAGRAGFQIVLITNQSGVGRGRIPEEALEEIHETLRLRLLEAGGRLDGIYHCPHHPEAGLERFRRTCNCRKPEPGMLLRARDEMGIDLESSYVIGDRLGDVGAARAAGATAVLVRTGVGTEHEQRLDGAPPAPHVADDLPDAVRWILRRESVETTDEGGSGVD